MNERVKLLLQWGRDLMIAEIACNLTLQLSKISVIRKCLILRVADGPVDRQPASARLKSESPMTPQLPANKQQRSMERLRKPPEIVVFEIGRESQCSQCTSMMRKPAEVNIRNAVDGT